MDNSIIDTVRESIRKSLASYIGTPTSKDTIPSMANSIIDSLSVIVVGDNIYCRGYASFTTLPVHQGLLPHHMYSVYLGTTDNFHYVGTFIRNKQLLTDTTYEVDCTYTFLEE